MIASSIATSRDGFGSKRWPAVAMFRASNSGIISRQLPEGEFLSGHSHKIYYGTWPCAVRGFRAQGSQDDGIDASRRPSNLQSIVSRLDPVGQLAPKRVEINVRVHVRQHGAPGLHRGYEG